MRKSAIAWIFCSVMFGCERIKVVPPAKHLHVRQPNQVQVDQRIVEPNDEPKMEHWEDDRGAAR